MTNSLECKINLPLKVSSCDPATAAKAGDLCRCRFDNMAKVSDTACACVEGFSLVAGKGCVKKTAAPKCDLATTLAKNGQCACKFANMVKASASTCACAQGFRFAPGKGCFKPEPVCGKNQVLVKGVCRNKEPVCGKNQVLVKGRCVNKQPVCKKPFVYDPKRNACVEVIAKCSPGQIRIKGKCVSVPKCPPGTIPVPGTRACVSIGIGIGGPRPDGPRSNGPGDIKPRCNPAVQECR